MSDTAPTILLTALRDEIQPTLRRLGLQLDHPGEVRGQPVLPAVSGLGGERIVRRLHELLSNHNPARVILFGVVGALDPQLKEGELVRPGRVIADNEPAIEFPGGDAGQTLYTSPTMISTVEAKAEAFEAHGAQTVDMETYHAAKLLRARGIWLTVIRAVCDTADVALPAQTVKWVREDGQPDAAAAAIYLALHPMQLPTLLNLRDAMRLAAHNLAQAVDRAIDE